MPQRPMRHDPSCICIPSRAVYPVSSRFLHLPQLQHLHSTHHTLPTHRLCRRISRLPLLDDLLFPDRQHSRGVYDGHQHHQSLRRRRGRGPRVHGDLEAAAGQQLQRAPLGRKRLAQLSPRLGAPVRPRGHLERHRPPQARGQLQLYPRLAPLHCNPARRCCQHERRCAARHAARAHI